MPPWQNPTNIDKEENKLETCINMKNGWQSVKEQIDANGLVHIAHPSTV